MELELGGHRFVALSERALWSEAAGTLFVADVHLGKTDAFRAAGVPLPDGTTEDDLARLDMLIARLGPRRLIVLGDLIHCGTGLTESLVERVATWRLGHEALSVTLVRGNHDRRTRRMPEAWRLDEVEEPFAWNGIELRHHPTAAIETPQLAGHVHPSARLVGRGGLAVRLPCFWLRGERLVLPAFTAFSGGGRFDAAREDRILVIAESEVIEAPVDSARRRLFASKPSA